MFSLICVVFVFILNNHNETKTADENPLSSSNKTEGLYLYIVERMIASKEERLRRHIKPFKYVVINPRFRLYGKNWRKYFNNKILFYTSYIYFLNSSVTSYLASSL